MARDPEFAEATRELDVPYIRLSSVLRPKGMSAGLSVVRRSAAICSLRAEQFSPLPKLHSFPFRGKHMSAPLKDRITGALAEVRTRALFTLKLEVRPLILVGDTPTTFRRIGIVCAGRFEGERLSGEVLDGGSDWQSVRSDGSTVLDVRLTIKTDEGALIAVTYKGLRHSPPDVIARIEKGEEVDPASYYFRINPMFETASERYAWLNGILAVGIGHRFADGPVYNLFELL